MRIFVAIILFVCIVCCSILLYKSNRNYEKILMKQHEDDVIDECMNFIKDHCYDEPDSEPKYWTPPEPTIEIEHLQEYDLIHAKWADSEWAGIEEHKNWRICSNCRQRQGFGFANDNYCPVCGAKMDLK